MGSKEAFPSLLMRIHQNRLFLFHPNRKDNEKVRESGEKKDTTLLTHSQFTQGENKYPK